MSISDVVTFDGPAGVGKSTVARRIADILCYPYLDTGAMYRTLALHLGVGAESLPPQQLQEKCRSLVFHLEGYGNRTRLLCNGIVIGEEIRNETVGAMASRIAAVPIIRQCLQQAQRHLGELGPLVAEGRDMGSKVFPDAGHKFFLDAVPEIRARRRYVELIGKGVKCRLDDLTELIRKRDANDRTRAVDPLRPAEDAVVIDTTSMDIDGVVSRVLQILSKDSDTMRTGER